MSVYTKSVGLRNVGSYQVSGTPWVTGSNLFHNVNYSGIANGEVKIKFPFVTKSIMVENTGSAGDIRVHWRESTAGSVITGLHYWSIEPGDVVTFDVKCKEVYLSVASSVESGFEMFADLTQIPTGSMFVLTGSGITEDP